MRDRLLHVRVDKPLRRAGVCKTKCVVLYSLKPPCSLSASVRFMHGLNWGCKKISGREGQAEAILGAFERH